MSGSLKLFPYVMDSGIRIHVKLDESNTEAVNQNISGFVAGAPVFPNAGKLRYALYSSQDGSTRVRAVVLTLAGLATIPAVITVSGIDGDGNQSDIVCALTTTRGERFQRATQFDTGKTDGDQP